MSFLSLEEDAIFLLGNFIQYNFFRYNIFVDSLIHFVIVIFCFLKWIFKIKSLFTFAVFFLTGNINYI